MPETKNTLRVTLPTDTTIRLEREFDAPRDVVWEAMTNPKYIPQWWGPHGHTTEVLEADVRPGGAWRFISRTPDGTEHPFKGVYREIVPPEKIVQTFIYDVPPIDQFESVETLTLEEREGRTYCVAISEHGSKEARDGMVQSGMEAGASETYDRLESLIATLA